MKRFNHYVKQNHNSEQPSHLICLDTESDQEQVDAVTKLHKLKFGFAAYTRRRGEYKWSRPDWFRFTDARALYEFIVSKARPKIKLYVFCHNSNFDYPLTDIIGNMVELGYTLKGAIIAAPPTIIKFQKGPSTIIFMDTLNWFKMSLKDLGKSINLEKYEDTDENGNLVFDDKRCKRDTEIIIKAMQDWLYFIKANDLGGFAPTLAGQSFRAYRHRFMPEKLLVDCNDDATRISRAAYFGGRTEAFRLGKIRGPLHLVDVVSRYPASMRDNLYPTRLKSVWNNPSIRELEVLLNDYCITAECTVDTPRPVFPLRKNNRLCFPTGRFTTYLSTPEIEYAIKNGYLISCGQVAFYHRASIFTDFVDFFNAKRYEAKDHDDDAGSMMFKGILVSLYGKFGQLSSPWESIGRTTDLSSKCWSYHSDVTDEHDHYRQFGGLLQKAMPKQEHPESIPAIAAHVTAYARMDMWRLMEKAGKENVYYTDTDSLLLNSIGFTALWDEIDASRLGGLSHDATYASVEIYGAKDYRFGKKVKIKGIKKSAKKLSENSFQQDQWSSLRGMVRRGGMVSPTTTVRVKNLKRIYLKGDVLPEGRVAPFLLAPQDQLPPVPAGAPRRRKRRVVTV